MMNSPIRAWMLVYIMIMGVCRSSPVGQLAVSSQNPTGHSMLQLGISFNNSLVSMLGHAIVSLEEYMHNMDSRLTTKLCELSPCTPWSVWTHCSAKVDGTFGGQTRTRTCWVGNTTPCSNDGEQVIDNESQICNGFCPEEYKISNNGLCLMAITSLNSRDESEKICNEKGGHLMNTDTEGRWNDLVEIGERLSVDKIWIDGIRSIQAGPWKYASGVEPSLNGLQRWYSNEPSNGGTELCKVTQKFSGKYSWCDRGCSEKYNAVCEIRT